jgi:hypothetical protein
MRHLTKGNYYYHKRWLANHPNGQIDANRKWKHATDAKQREEMRKIFDLKCAICGKVDSTIKLGVFIHKKDGKPHNYDKVYRLKYILAHPEEFAPLCRSHHRFVHTCMKHGSSWEQIISQMKLPSVNP